MSIEEQRLREEMSAVKPGPALATDAEARLAVLNKEIAEATAAMEAAKELDRFAEARAMQRKVIGMSIEEQRLREEMSAVKPGPALATDAEARLAVLKKE